MGRNNVSVLTQPFGKGNSESRESSSSIGCFIFSTSTYYLLSRKTFCSTLPSLSAAAPPAVARISSDVQAQDRLLQWPWHHTSPPPAPRTGPLSQIHVVVSHSRRPPLPVARM
ncbi:unnamed protein product [Linum tenue]|uniref:Uncharacterized protein n=1 Tax=Linum tenue TaxID=586396 RepID=A0AAV0H9W7_9ROSI|nr:unnamed protein product [Linum tenue]CAI0412197.1 unnamed protein product [Linum tenue]